MKRTQLFKDSWAHCAVRPYISETKQRFWTKYHNHCELDVPKLHAEYWSMVSAELRQPTIMLKLV